MNSFFDKLNLRPQERRLIMALGLIFFFILNFWLVWPQFKLWGKVETDFKKVGLQLSQYEREVAKISSLNTTLAALQAQGSDVLPAEQALNLSRTVANIADRSKVRTLQRGKVTKAPGSTNMFFDEQSMNLDVEAKEPEMVELLISLASDSSLIRVKDLQLRASKPQQQFLIGNLKLVASYQKEDKK